MTRGTIIKGRGKMNDVIIMKNQNFLNGNSNLANAYPVVADTIVWQIASSPENQIEFHMVVLGLSTRHALEKL